MGAVPLRKTCQFDRHELATSAVQTAARLRGKLGVGQHAPICIYDTCQKRNVTVRFTDINMEGMYKKGAAPKILLSANRPLSRRAFTCAHELGHHEFGHGSAIDELTERAELNSWENPEEFLADTFAAHLLMPLIGLRGAFNLRGWNPETALPEQFYVIACDFGVGYATLITHLSVGLGIISGSQAKQLHLSSPKTIRAQLLGEESKNPLIVAGTKRTNPLIDAEVNTHLLLPKEVVVDAKKLAPVRQLKNATLFEAVESGITQIRTKNWSAFVRIAREEYVGLARFRHLEDE